MSPATPPILTNELFIASLRYLSLTLEWYDDAVLLVDFDRPCGGFLCLVHRKAPGCFEGEHMHAFFLVPAATAVPAIWPLLWLCLLSAKGFLVFTERLGVVSWLNRKEEVDIELPGMGKP